MISINMNDATHDSVEEISAEQLKQRLGSEDPPLVLDVRSSEEYELANIGGLLIPMDEIPMRFSELPQDRSIVVHCHFGMRSAHVIQFLKEKGYKRLYNLRGGIDAWSLEVDESLPRY